MLSRERLKVFADDKRVRFEASEATVKSIVFPALYRSDNGRVVLVNMAAPVLSPPEVVIWPVPSARSTSSPVMLPMPVRLPPESVAVPSERVLAVSVPAVSVMPAVESV